MNEDNMKPIREGPVYISFAKPGEKIKVTFIVDFNKTDLSAEAAGELFSSIVFILRSHLDVRLSKCK